MEPGRSDTARPDRHGRFRLVDAMRGLAALAVVFYHVAFRFGVPGNTPLMYLSERNAGPPITAVILFFVISGFVLYRPFASAHLDGRPMPALVPYAVRRIARIAPAYWVALTVVSVWFGYRYMLHPGEFIRYFGFLQLYGNHTTAGRGISVAWTLCVEVTFYAAVPMLALGARRLAAARTWPRRSGQARSPLAGELTLCALMVVASLVYQVAITTAVPASSSWFLSWLSMLPGSLDVFAAGMLLATLSAEHERRAAPRPWVAVGAGRPWLAWLVGLAALYLQGRLPASLGITGWWLLSHALKLTGCALLLSPLVFDGFENGLIRRVLGSRPLVWIGTVSYGIYLWHFPVLDKLAPSIVGHGELYSTVAMVLISIAAGALSYYVVERPAQRLARAFLSGRRRPAPVAAAGGPVAVVAAPPPDRP